MFETPIGLGAIFGLILSICIMCRERKDQKAAKRAGGFLTSFAVISMLIKLRNKNNLDKLKKRRW